jgi:CRP-like cAMP-binding protein
MNANDDSSYEALIAKLRRMGPLNDEDVAALEAIPVRRESRRAGTYVVREGDRVETCAVLLTGYGCRSKTTREGRRQIVSFHMPGDILDVQHILLERADHNVQVITNATYIVMKAADLRDLVRRRSNIAEALWRDSLIDASVFREWVLNVGQRDARTRIAHMLCEFAMRNAAAGQGSPELFDLPMTQETIGDATGLTPVHVNRMLAALDSEGVIVRQRQQIQIADWPRMKRIADFDPAYLHEAA